MRSRFVRPDTRTLTISHGDTLVVKGRLNHGEQTALFARMYLAGVDGTMKMNPLASGMAIVTAYLLDWSLRDDEGKPVVIRDKPIEAVTAALDALEPESFTEIKDAIEAHENVMATERAQEKNDQGGATNEPAISPSPESAAGASSGSASSTSMTTTS